jgi:hypothetical protein
MLFGRASRRGKIFSGTVNIKIFIKKELKFLKNPILAKLHF